MLRALVSVLRRIGSVRFERHERFKRQTPVLLTHATDKRAERLR